MVLRRGCSVGYTLAVASAGGGRGGEHRGCPVCGESPRAERQANAVFCSEACGARHRKGQMRLARCVAAMRAAVTAARMVCGVVWTVGLEHRASTRYYSGQCRTRA
ncbi:DUF2116 family Zn-ribbon domain-containing protein [Streptomyces arenae]|uniref:DUF2116 family Zn-ribbon domain-containing protein n=1 Tax=Streptomyces arenae TaxID=29301 RepID=UPI003D2B7D81